MTGFSNYETSPGSGVLLPPEAFIQKVGGINQAPSAVSQFKYDDAIDKLISITDKNSQLSKEYADAANAFTAAQNDKAMRFSAAEAAKNRDWQKMMSDTAHQREVRDLMAAGLNPVLSAMGGNGAAVTSGATAASSSGSGQKGEVDHSMSQAMVSLLSSVLAAQTNLFDSTLSAQTSRANADALNETTLLAALMQGQFGLAKEQMSGEYGLKKQGMSDAAAWERSKLSAQTAKDVANISGEWNYNIHRDFPNTLWSTIGSVIEQWQNGGPMADFGDALTDFNQGAIKTVGGIAKSIVDGTVSFSKAVAGLPQKAVQAIMSAMSDMKAHKYDWQNDISIYHFSKK